MKFLLVQPSHLRDDGTVFKSRRLQYPGLGLLLVAGLTPRDIELHYINEYAEEINYDGDYDLVALSVLTPQAVRAYQIADEFRRRGRSKVVLGGIHPSLMSEEAALHADCVAMGEAEFIWPQLVRDFRGGSLKNIYKADALQDLSCVPEPRYDLLCRGNYSMRALPVQTTRGCPHDCSFCAVTEFYGRSYRFRPIEHVVRDVRAAKSKYIFFVDDNIAANHTYLERLCEGLIPLGITWGSQTNVSIAKDEALLRLAVRSGCFTLFLGVESLSEESLKRANKAFNKIEDYSRAFKAMRRCGIVPMVSMVLGLEGDTEETMRETALFLQRERVPIAYLFILTPCPGTRLFREYTASGRIFDKDWNRYVGDRVVFTHPHLTREALEGWLWKIYKEFYSLNSIVRRLFFPPVPHPGISLRFNLLHRRSVRKGIHPMRG